MIRTIKDATVHRYFYESHSQLRTHLKTYIMAYNFARRLKRLDGLIPFDFIQAKWLEEPERFYFDPYHLTLGLNT